MKRVLLIGAAAAALSGLTWLGLKLPSLRGTAPTADQVVLLHGLGRGENAMLLLENRLTRAGYEVHSIDYPSLSEAPDALVRTVGEQVEQCCANNGRTVHFVAHSLGGLLTRTYLDRRPLRNLGKVVLMGTPNKGSELVDEFGDLWLFKVVGGPTTQVLGTDENSLPNRIGAPYYPLGIIAGNGAISPLARKWLRGENDGVVAVESTKLEGMTDFLELDTSHTLMRYDAQVAEEIIHFLEHGYFSHSSPAAD